MLQVNLDESVSAVGISELSKLTELRELLFPQSFEYLRNKPVQLCLQLLPHLRVVGERIDIRETKSAHLDEMCVDLHKLPKRCLVGLEQLVLRNWVLLPNSVKLPNLTALYVQDPFQAIRPDVRFKRVTELGLTDQDNMNSCASLLEHLGDRLQKLVISLDGDVLQLDEVFRLCPELIELHLLGSPTGVDSNGPLPPDALRRLQALTIDFRELNSTSCNPRIQLGLLVELLHGAEELQYLKLAYVSMWEDDEEGLDIFRLLKQKSIFKKLQTFLYYDFTSDCEYESVRYPFPEYVDNVGWVVAAMELNCPHLTKIKQFS